MVRTLQEYLGTAEKIRQCVRQSKNLPHIRLKSFQYGKTAAPLCITGMPFYRYLAWRCKHLRISLKRIVEALEGIRVALVKDKTWRGCELMVELMDSRLARLFSLLDLGRFMADFRTGIWRTDVLVPPT